MRTSYAVLLIITLTFAGLHWYTTEGAVCRVPVEWRIGEIDGRFAITEAEAKAVVEDAAAVWEETTERDLFVYDESSDFTINFVFDERQQVTNAAEAFKDRLDEKQQANETLSSTYNTLVTEYEERQQAFETQKAAFENRLAAYNAKVAQYNEAGGAPAAVFDELEATRTALDTEQRQVSAAVRSLNALGEELNALSSKGNQLIETYNDAVNRYNENFGYREGFTQGDYQGDKINVYEYKNLNELTLVLAHELGHALSLDHVENEASVMHFEMGGQDFSNISLSDEDIAQFVEFCSVETMSDRFKNFLGALL